jgi:hypothetical protein
VGECMISVRCVMILMFFMFGDRCSDDTFAWDGRSRPSSSDVYSSSFRYIAWFIKICIILYTSELNGEIENQ